MPVVREGTVREGDYQGWTVIVEDDRDGEAGGYYLYLTNNAGQGFDYWFDVEIALQAQLDDFKVDWVG